MGLNQVHKNRNKSLRGRFFSWWLPGVMIAASVVIALLGTHCNEWLRYDRAAMIEGLPIGLLSGHFVHLGWSHLLLNAAGLVLVWLLVGSAYRPWQWCLVVILSIAAIDVGMWYLDPELDWYVGMSGMLHGVLAAGLIRTWDDKMPELRVVAVLLVVKLIYEQLAGPLPGSEATSGGAVVVNAHLYGTIGGCLAAALLYKSTSPMRL